MVAIAPAAPVTGAARVPLPYGLFSVAAIRGSGDRWESGVEWETPTTDLIDGIGAWQVPPTATIGLPKDLAKNAGALGAASPFTVYGHWQCSPIGYTPAEAQDKANEHLLIREEGKAESAFWKGDLGNTPNLSTGATTLAGGTAVPMRSAISLLEDYIASSYGSLGVIHMTRGTANAGLAALVLTKTGSRLTTALGTPVVAGSGYPGTSPGGAAGGANESWMRASPAIFGYRGDVFTSSDNPGDLLDRGLNNLYAVAERQYLLGFDPTGVGAVLVALA